jgi:hypothetical protein
VPTDRDSRIGRGKKRRDSAGRSRKRNPRGRFERGSALVFVSCSRNKLPLPQLKLSEKW